MESRGEASVREARSRWTWQHNDVPRITAATVAEHREQRRDALLDAAAQVLRERGDVTVGAVAARAGISRTAVYEYYNSAADLIADVLVDELAMWIDHLESAVAGIEDPAVRLRTWIATALSYVADGRHSLVRAAGRSDLPPVRRAQVQDLHRRLAGSVYVALRELGADDPERTASYIWSVTEAATRHIEAGRDADEEIAAAIRFALAGIATTR